MRLLTNRRLHRTTSHVGLIALVAIVIWVSEYEPLGHISSIATISLPRAKIETAPLGPSPWPALPLSEKQSKEMTSITRNILIHTNVPNRPRQEIIEYIVLEGDTLFGIAEKHGISPETVLWANQYILQDDPHLLRPGQNLLISPVNGVVRLVQPNDTVDGLARAYRSSLDEIVNWLGNKLLLAGKT